MVHIEQTQGGPEAKQTRKSSEIAMPSHSPLPFTCPAQLIFSIPRRARKLSNSIATVNPQFSPRYVSRCLTQQESHGAHKILWPTHFAHGDERGPFMRQFGVIVEDFLRTEEFAVSAPVREFLTGSFIVSRRPNTTCILCLPPS